MNKLTGKINSSDVLVLMALPSESQGLFEAAGIAVHYSGIGKINAAMKTMELIMRLQPKQILNLGTAGSHKFKTHELIECSAFVQKDMDITPLGFPLGQTPLDDIPGKIEVSTLTKLKKGICGTGDVFEIGPPRLACDLVDMEAYAIAKVCKKMQVELTAIKYITDGSDPHSKDDWIKNLQPASESLFRIYQEIVQL
ncbi:MAG: 5'-nucleosidase [Bdellovibrionota bacterium]